MTTENTKVAGFIITIPEVSKKWMYAGQTIEEVLGAIRTELLASELSPQDFGSIVVTRRWFTQNELDTMPEFPGW